MEFRDNGDRYGFCKGLSAEGLFFGEMLGLLLLRIGFDTVPVRIALWDFRREMRRRGLDAGKKKLRIYGGTS